MDTTPEAATLSWPGLLVSLALLAVFAVAADAVPGDPRHALPLTFALSLNTGVVAALSLVPSRRQFPMFLLIVGVVGVLVRLRSEPVAAALPVTLANVQALVVFRILALRYAAGGCRLDDARCLVSLLGCAVAGVAVNAAAAAGLTGVGVAAGLVPGAGTPSIPFILGLRLPAQGDGIVTVMPLVLMLMRRRPRSWGGSTWFEVCCWLAALAVVSVLALRLRDVPLVNALALLGAFAVLMFAVLRRGSLAAAVLTPAFAVASAAMLASLSVGQTGDPSTFPILSSQLAAFLAALLAWAVATVVSQREAARRLVHSQEAAAHALATLQAALLPVEVTSPPGVEVAARYRAAGVHDQIGGDWYDTIALPTGGTALVIGDVEGHDLTAASAMGLVRGAVRSYALEGHPPSIVLERVSAFLTSAGIDRLVTMAYVQLYPDDASATVALAGHPPPLVVTRGGAVSVLVTRPGPLLGVEGLTGWPEQTVVLPPQASLLLYTDGLVDFPAAGNDQQDCLTALAAAAADRPVEVLAEALLAAAPSYDDAAVLVARQTHRSAGRARRTLAAEPISATIARTWLSDLLDGWCVDDRSTVQDPAAQERLHVAQLLLTELVSNAVRHTDRWVEVSVRVQGARLWVGVVDTSDRLPVFCQASESDCGGRGLRLVDALATSWGVRLEEDGKTVWFELAPAGREASTPRGMPLEGGCDLWSGDEDDVVAVASPSVPG